MSPATATACSRIAPLDLPHALDVYAARLAAMTDAQLTEERHRLEGQWPLGEAWRLANDQFEKRNPITATAPTTRWGVQR